MAALAVSNCGAMINHADAAQPRVSAEERVSRLEDIEEQKGTSRLLGFTTLVLIGQGFARKVLTDGPARKMLGEVLPVATISLAIAMYVAEFKSLPITDNNLSTKKRFNAFCSSMIQLSAAAAVLYGGISKAGL